MIRNNGQGTAASTSRSITQGPINPMGSQNTSEGENSEVGSRYTASIDERVNKSNPRNQGPSRSTTSAAVTTLPVYTRDMRDSRKV